MEQIKVDVQKFTRARAERYIAASDSAQHWTNIEAFLAHKNKHVRDKAMFKLALPEERRALTVVKYIENHIKFIDAMPPDEEHQLAFSLTVDNLIKFIAALPS
jgi:hypothetical protein